MPWTSGSRLHMPTHGRTDAGETDAGETDAGETDSRSRWRRQTDACVECATKQAYNFRACVRAYNFRACMRAYVRACTRHLRTTAVVSNNDNNLRTTAVVSNNNNNLRTTAVVNQQTAHLGTLHQPVVEVMFAPIPIDSFTRKPLLPIHEWGVAVCTHEIGSAQPHVRK